MEAEDILEAVDSGAEAEAGAANPGSQVARAGGRALGPMTKEELKSRFVEQMNGMLDEAAERAMLPVFADVVSWKLAVLAHRCGPYVTGDVLRHLGQHLSLLAERDAAQREADAEKAGGRNAH